MRVVACALGALIALVIPVGSAAAGPTPSPAAVSKATPVCTVTDPRAIELSGLVATGDGYVSITDSRDDPSQILIFYLDRSCRVTRTLGYPTAARDPEDVAQAPDGTLWVADTGDNFNNTSRRRTVALWHVPQDGGPPVIYRLTYPDGPHDAEALFFTANATPVIVTKDITGIAGLYEPARAVQARTAAGVPLRKVGEFAPVPRNVSNPFGIIGEVLVTGAATSPDRRRVVLRTYSAAYEWDVPDGDPVKAITTTEPRITPLPNEPQGEAIAYTVDGSAFLTVSDAQGPATLLRYMPSGRSAPAATTTAAPPGTAAPSSTPGLARALEAVPGWALIGLAVGGLGLATAGIAGLLRSRRRSGF